MKLTTCRKYIKWEIYRMKGKAKEKRKIGKAILIGMGFFLTIILTFTTTLAWFYDSDWANKYINMAGTVGIEIRREKQPGEADDVNLRTSGTGNLYFHLFNEATNPKAYPGQAINVSASAYNNGGKSGDNGSACYIRAHFVVYTNIGKLPDPNDYLGTEDEGGTDALAYIATVDEYKKNTGITEPTETQLELAGIKASDYISANGTGDDSVAFIRDTNTANAESGMNAEALYAFLYNLIAKQNADKNTTGYYWHYYKHTGALALSDTGTADSEVKYYIDGQVVSASESTTATDSFVESQIRSLFSALSGTNLTRSSYSSDTYIVSSLVSNIIPETEVSAGTAFFIMQ